MKTFKHTLLFGIYELNSKKIKSIHVKCYIIGGCSGQTFHENIIVVERRRPFELRQCWCVVTPLRPCLTGMFCVLAEGSQWTDGVL